MVQRSAADNAGAREFLGRVVMRVDGRAVGGGRELRNALRRPPRGTRVVLTFRPAERAASVPGSDSGRSGSTEGISATGESVPITDPFSAHQRRIADPVRGRDCRHKACFDRTAYGAAYAQAAARAKRKRKRSPIFDRRSIEIPCPVAGCSRMIHPDRLVGDGAFAAALSAAPDGATALRVNGDAFSAILPAERDVIDLTANAAEDDDDSDPLTICW